jgi:tetratricopeptide (TPR) repeat protein
MTRRPEYHEGTGRCLIRTDEKGGGDDEVAALIPRVRMLSRVVLPGALALVLLLAGVPAPVAADGGGGSADSASRPAAKAEDPDYTGAVKAIKAGGFTAAITLLERVVAREPTNADAYNWLGYAIRRNGDPARSIPLYERALVIDPTHRGAHEYIGEAYLMLGELAKAREHLARLDSLCLLSCSEYRDLKKAVEAYEKSGGKIKPAAAR